MAICARLSATAMSILESGQDAVTPAVRASLDRRDQLDPLDL